VSYDSLLAAHANAIFIHAHEYVRRRDGYDVCGFLFGHGYAYGCYDGLFYSFFRYYDIHFIMSLC
jgi:hypothetical protein